MVRVLENCFVLGFDLSLVFLLGLLKAKKKLSCPSGIILLSVLPKVLEPLVGISLGFSEEEPAVAWEAGSGVLGVGHLPVNSNH